jgi:hypothetical protein
MRLPAAEYLRRYEEEVREYVQYQQDFAALSGENAACRNSWEREHPASVKGDARRIRDWLFYARKNGPLKVMNPDGSYRPWSVEELEG